MNLRVLFRVDRDNEDEYEAALRVLGEERVTRFRTDLQEGDLVVGRYSTLPFFSELSEEVGRQGASMINTVSEYTWIATMGWYQALEGLTPVSYFEVGWKTVPDAEHGWVVKGATNSRKQKWSTHMRAETRDDLKEVMQRLWDDPLLGEQGLVVREYVPLRAYEVGVRGMPMTNEWRCFFLTDELNRPHMVGAGYYWSQAERADQMGELPEAARELAFEAAERCARHATFFVVDVGEVVEAPGSEEHSHWTVIEVNSGQMAGLSMIEPESLYHNLDRLLT